MGNLKINRTTERMGEPWSTILDHNGSLRICRKWLTLTRTKDPPTTESRSLMQTKAKHPADNYCRSYARQSVDRPRPPSGDGSYMNSHTYYPHDVDERNQT